MKAGWIKKPLGEVCEFRRGLTYAKSDEVDSGGTAVLRAMNIDLDTGELDLNDIRYIASSVAVPQSKMVEPGTLLICTASGSKKHLGKTALVDQPMEYAFGGFMGLLVPSRSILPKYLRWIMRSDAYWEFIDQLSSGTNINNLKFSQLSAFRIPLPPLEEQQRIVAVLDEAFEGLARARAHAEANLQNARELFESVLDEVFSNSPTHWTRSILGKTCTFIGGSQPPKSEFVYTPAEDLVRLIQIRDYKSDKNIVYIPRAAARRFCEEDDVMIGRYGPPLFQILRGIKGAYNVALMKAVPKSDLMSKDFLFYFLQNRRIFQYINEASSRAAGQIGLNKATLEPYPISYPEGDEQREVVERLDAAKIYCDKTIEQYLTKLQDLDDLSQSLLQKAFAGELT